MADIDDIRKRLAECPIPEDLDTKGDGFVWLIAADSDDEAKLGDVIRYACAYRRDVKRLLEAIEERGNGGKAAA